MKHERGENYEWALRHLRHLFGQKLPTAIVSDRELGLLKAAERVFPEVKHLLCRVHVHRNVEAIGYNVQDKQVNDPLICIYIYIINIVCISIIL